jgi:hypothetical protein
MGKLSGLYVLKVEPYRGTANCRTASWARHWQQKFPGTGRMHHAGAVKRVR